MALLEFFRSVDWRIWKSISNPAMAVAPRSVPPIVRTVRSMAWPSLRNKYIASQIYPEVFLQAEFHEFLEAMLLSRKTSSKIQSWWQKCLPAQLLCSAYIFLVAYKYTLHFEPWWRSPVKLSPYSHSRKCK